MRVYYKRFLNANAYAWSIGKLQDGKVVANKIKDVTDLFVLAKLRQLHKGRKDEWYKASDV